MYRNFSYLIMYRISFTLHTCVLLHPNHTTFSTPLQLLQLPLPRLRPYRQLEQLSAFTCGSMGSRGETIWVWALETLAIFLLQWFIIITETIINLWWSRSLSRLLKQGKCPIKPHKGLILILLFGLKLWMNYGITIGLFKVVLQGQEERGTEKKVEWQH